MPEETLGAIVIVVLLHVAISFSRHLAAMLNWISILQFGTDK